MNQVVISSILKVSIVGEIRMAKPKKNGTYLNVCIETPIYERLERLCDDAGQTKTVAVERALTAYLQDYEKKQMLLKEMDSSARQ